MLQSLDVPLSAFNVHLIEEAGKMNAQRECFSRTYSDGNRNGARSPRPHTRSISASVISKQDVGRNPIPQRNTRSMSEQQVYNSGKQYIRPTGSELVSSKHPSCLGLPPNWDTVHDRFIAYLATHAPLDQNGKVPRHEEKEDRWRIEDIATEVMERFPTLGYHIKPSMVEKRLSLLDQAGDNDFFKIPYGAYMYEAWGYGI